LYIRNKGKDFHSAQAWTEDFNWGSVAGYGSEILLKNEALIKDKSLIEEIKLYFAEHSKMLLAKSSKNAFNVAITNIPWGSNGYLMDEVHSMKVAYDLSKDQKLLDTASLQLNYLLGNNPNGYCYVTGFGAKPVVNPHHRQSGYFNKVMPGMLAGGPCSALLDAAAKEHLTGKAPLQCYIDHSKSYSTNEIAIYWNSPLVLALAWLSH